MDISNDAPIVDMKGIVDREQVQLIYNILERQSIVLITGVGGIGKTTIANLYQYKYGDKYDQVSRKNYSELMEPQNTVQSLISEINSSDEKRLIIIDDVDKGGLSFFSDRFGTINKNCHIILISRNIIQDIRIPVITISGLTSAEALSLVEKIIPLEHTEEDRHIIFELSNFIEGNPLAIKLMADIFNQKPFKSIAEFRNEIVHNLAFTLGVAKKPIEIYIDTDNAEQIQNVYGKTKEFIRQHKFDVESELPPEKGSWYKRFFVRFSEISQSDEVKERVREAEFGIKLHHTCPKTDFKKS